MGLHEAESSKDRLVLALRRLNRAVSVSNRAMGASLGIKESDFAVLDLLSQEGPQTPTELSHSLGIHAATMTGILSRLERDGWIERHPADDDRRSIQIHAAGTERLTARFESVNERIADLVSDLSPSQVESLASLLVSVAQVTQDSALELPTNMQ